MYALNLGINTMSTGPVELAPAPAGPFQDIVRVETRETSGCDGCEPNGACQDYVLRDDIIFPAYKNTENNKCLNRESMLNVIRYRMADTGIHTRHVGAPLVGRPPQDGVRRRHAVRPHEAEEERQEPVARARWVNKAMLDTSI